MKFLVFSIATLVCMLSTTTINFIDSNTTQNSHLNKFQDYSYLNQNLIISSKSIDDITCASCHGSLRNSSEITLEVDDMTHLQTYFNPYLIVHNENHPSFSTSLETFVETHDTSEALEKNVDRQKVVDYIVSF